ncbi:PPOX class F420-dependent oxidoreductase [Nocardioides mangrovicus]|uniref:PPOX class F420-dependent oxidoreductase n=1 Tax=Nocardioides mangrovicus TaxID=2478913 RepID=A0A3L8NZZ0_9ACTN|nr:PPOX class F420-dependent oxidoreductase [Nocardioides mangrovicus]RLV48123.1 PPOX class F420-dependent oxidoreductase [Nocardioides mangrovicus]
MEIAEALDFVRGQRQVVLVTLRRNARPQLSNVLAHVGDDGVLRISITESRAKYKNLVREPWGAVHATSDDRWSWVVVEGDVTLSDVVRDPHDDAAEELVRLYRDLAGEHPDWEEYRASLVAEGRVVVRLRPDHAYGQLPQGR